MNTNPYPHISMHLLIVTLCLLAFIAIISIYGLWLSWFNQVKIDQLETQILEQSNKHKAANVDIAILAAQVNEIPGMILNCELAKKNPNGIS